MSPTIQDGNIIIVDTTYSWLREVKPFDVVLIKSDSGVPLVKRIIGIEGDSVEVENNTLYVNNLSVEEPYTKDNNKQHITEDFDLYSLTDVPVVPQNKLFVLGDNRAVSEDSRHSSVGYVDLDNVVGKVKYRITDTRIKKVK